MIEYQNKGVAEKHKYFIGLWKTEVSCACASMVASCFMPDAMMMLMPLEKRSRDEKSMASTTDGRVEDRGAWCVGGVFYSPVSFLLFMIHTKDRPLKSARPSTIIHHRSLLHRPCQSSPYLTTSFRHHPYRQHRSQYSHIY